MFLQLTLNLKSKLILVHTKTYVKFSFVEILKVVSGVIVVVADLELIKKLMLSKLRGSKKLMQND